MTNTVSNASPVTTATGDFSGAAGVTVRDGLPASIDPQVDYVAIFRTQDGGALVYYPRYCQQHLHHHAGEYQINGYVDTTLDANLNILIQAPLADQNTPASDRHHKSDLPSRPDFGSVGNTVYRGFGPDTPVGNGNEGFPPLNSAVFPSLVKRIVLTSLGALVFTVSDIYLIGGSATTSNPLYTTPFTTGLGLLSYSAVAVNGTTIYFFTANSQVVSLDPSSGLSQIGFPIGDQFTLSNWNPSMPM